MAKALCRNQQCWKVKPSRGDGSADEDESLCRRKPMRYGAVKHREIGIDLMIFLPMHDRALRRQAADDEVSTRFLASISGLDTHHHEMLA